MIRFIINKLMLIVLSILGVTTVIGFIIYQAPVDPAKLQFGQQADSESVQLLRKKYYLDRSFQEQVFRYLEDLSPIQWVNSDDPRIPDYSLISKKEFSSSTLILKLPYFRRSYGTGEKVSDMIMEAIPATALLGFCSMLIAAFFGLFLGIIAALKRDHWVDQWIISFTTLFYSIPSYISAILLAIVFGYWLQDYTHLPIQGSLVGLDDHGNEVIDFRKIILPSFALGLRPIAMIAQMTRTSLIDAYAANYCRTAKANGITESRILFKHIFPNALNPIITTMSGWMASLLTGAFFVEYVFNYKGMGDLTIQSLNQFDIPVVLACCVTTVSIFVIMNVVADVLYAVVDPRIKI